MTTTQHTAGPWFIDGMTGEGHINISTSATPLREFVARAHFENGKANALLIAAAPDLLDALQDLVERDRSEAAESGFTDDEMTWLEDARRAIAKAKGGAS